MNLTGKALERAIKNGEIWIAIVSNHDMQILMNTLPPEKRNYTHSIHCETVEDVTKMMLLIEAFDKFSIGEIKYRLHTIISPNYSTKSNKEND